MTVGDTSYRGLIGVSHMTYNKDFIRLLVATGLGLESGTHLHQTAASGCSAQSPKTDSPQSRLWLIPLAEYTSSATGNRTRS